MGPKTNPSRTVVAMLSWLASACAEPLPAAKNVDIARFLGDWYVLGHIPAASEKNAWNAVESYRLRAETQDVVETTFTFRQGAFDGPLETMRPTGYVSEGETGRWGMHFYWWQGPFRFEYVIVDLDPSYQEVVIGRSARDYVWVMARTPTISEASWTRLMGVVRKAGYEPAKVRRVPQRWGIEPDISPRERQPVLLQHR